MTRPTFGRPLASDRRHAPRLPHPGQMALAMWSADELAARRHLLLIDGGAAPLPGPATLAMRAAA